MWIRRILGLATLTCVSAAVADDATAYKLHTLYSFCAKFNCTDGQFPIGGLIADMQGNLYGLAQYGGQHSGGTVYELQNGMQHKRKLITLHNFCMRADCLDGYSPYGALIMDKTGNLYGTASAGGTNNAGVVFEIMLNSDRTKGRLKILYDFCSMTHCDDGKSPFSKLTYRDEGKGLPYDGTSSLYGETWVGGRYNNGIVFSLTPQTGRWKQSVLLEACQINGCPDGGQPTNLIMDASGNILGSAGYGLPSNGGLIFELLANQDWAEQVLYSFCPQSGCVDGFSVGQIRLDSSGNLIGETAGGGTGAACPPGDEGCGTVFKLIPNGIHSQESVLYNFCSLPDCKDGLGPNAIAIDNAGNFVGSTVFGGGNDIDPDGYGGGVVFSLSEGKLQVLHSFCAKTNCADGAYPASGIIEDASGNYYGTTVRGGANAIGSGGAGTIFELTP